MDNSIFKAGDKVYHYLHGWGTVHEWRGHKPCMSLNVKFDNNSGNCHIHMRALSFRYYTLEEGGFSQDRDEQLRGKFCTVWDDGDRGFTIRMITGIFKNSKKNKVIYEDSIGQEWTNAELLDNEVLTVLLKKELIRSGNDTGDNRDAEKVSE